MQRERSVMQAEFRKLSTADGKDIYEMLQRIPAEENGYHNGIRGLSYEEYKLWLLEARAESLQEGLIDGWKVPQTIYWLYVDGIPVGKGDIRHFLTDALRKGGGNIGYTIAPDQRGKGCGKLLLKLLLKEASNMGLDKVLLTIRSHNSASLGVAKANGGVVEHTENDYSYVWIDLGGM